MSLVRPYCDPPGTGWSESPELLSPLCCHWLPCEPCWPPCFSETAAACSRLACSSCLGCLQSAHSWPFFLFFFQLSMGLYSNVTVAVKHLLAILSKNVRWTFLTFYSFLKIEVCFTCHKMHRSQVYSDGFWECTQPCRHHLSQETGYFHLPWKFLLNLLSTGSLIRTFIILD